MYFLADCEGLLETAGSYYEMTCFSLSHAGLETGQQPHGNHCLLAGLVVVGCCLGALV